MRTPVAVLWLAVCMPAQVQPSHWARLEGRVVDPQQRPVSGALVTVEVDGELRGRTHTDGSGLFVFGKLPRQVVVVRASTTQPDIGGIWVDLLGLSRGFVQVVTMPARRVAGTVVDDDGQTVAGAWVTAAPNNAIEFAFASCCVQSDASGHYELPHLPFGPALVRAWAEGCDAFEGTVDGIEDVVLDCRVERDAGQEHRFSLRDATPEQIAAATLVVEARHASLPVPLPMPLRRVRANADGYWVVKGWPYADDLVVWLELPGAPTTPCTLTAYAGRGGCRGTFGLADETTTVRGRLLAPDDLAVAHRTLAVVPMDGDTSPTRRRVGRTDAGGNFKIVSPVDIGEQFALRVVDGDATIPATPPARAWFLAKHSSKPHDVTIQPARRIRLRVMSVDKTPAAGASVTIHTATKAGNAQGDRRLRGASGSPLAYGISDLDGNVEITGLDLRADETLACLVLAPTGVHESLFEVGDAASIELGTLTLEEAANLSVLALGDQGKALRGARVNLHIRNSVALPPRVAATDRDGKVVFTGLLPTMHTAWIAGSAPTMHEFVLERGANELVVR